MKRPKYKIISIKTLITVVNKIFKYYDEIQIAYLYGSYAKGTQTEFSDIDMGVILRRDFIAPALYFAKLSSKIEENLDCCIEIDLRILNEGSPRFLFQVIKYGKILYSINNTFRHEFELKVLYEYQDIKPMLDLYDKISVLEVLGGED